MNQTVHLEYNSYIRRKTYSFTIWQAKNFAIVQHTVQVFNPKRIYWSVKYHKLPSWHVIILNKEKWTHKGLFVLVNVNFIVITSMSIWVDEFAKFLIALPNTPSDHSKVVGSMLPYSSFIEMLFGFIVKLSIFAFLCLC